MLQKAILSFVCILLGNCLSGQESSDNLKILDIGNNANYQGFDLINVSDKRLFILAEHWHNIASVPEATLKLLTYLHQEANVRVLAIEQGASTAYLINKYLEIGDTVLLEHITRNTMFWGQENRQFFYDLKKFNENIEPVERIRIESFDIEYKMESAIFVVNDLIGDKEIPKPLQPTLGEFKRIFDSSREHRESYDGIAVMFYYNKEFVQNLVLKTLYDLEEENEKYLEFFDDDFVQFAQMILDMDDGFTFDYTNPNTKYRFRDKIIYKKFVGLLEEGTDDGILGVIGLRHATKPSSIYKLQNSSSSPIQGKVLNIRISALFNKSFMTNDLRRINFTYPGNLKSNDAMIIRHDNSDNTFKSKEAFDYTIFLNRNGSLTPYPNILQEDY